MCWRYPSRASGTEPLTAHPTGLITRHAMLRGFIIGWQQTNPATGNAAPGTHGRGAFVQAVQQPMVSRPGGLLLASAPGSVPTGAQAGGGYPWNSGSSIPQWRPGG
jgi:hypothetical protein